MMRYSLLVSLVAVCGGVRMGWLDEAWKGAIAAALKFGKSRRETHLYLDYGSASTEVLATWDRCNLPVVSAAEAEKFISALGQIPAQREPHSRPEKLFDSKAIRAQTVTYEDAAENPDFDFSSHEVEVSYQTEMTLRFALLASSRWRKEKGAFFAIYTNKETQQKEIIEVELNSIAHAVLYIYRLPGGGIGLVMTMKGSAFTPAWASLHDWFTNANRSLSGEPGLQGAVHNGYRNYRMRILDLMEATSLDNIRPLLEEWSGKKVAENNLKRWFYNGVNWKWVFFTGHSMGAGMAQIEAVGLAGRLGVTEADHKIFLGHVESPKIGSEDFAQFAEGHVSPHGGLGVEKLIDVITHVGSSTGLTTGMRVSPAPSGMTWREEHAFFHVPASVNGKRGIVRFTSVCTSSRPTTGCTSKGCRLDKPIFDIWANDRAKYDVLTGGFARD